MTKRQKEIIQHLRAGHRALQAQFPCTSYLLGPLRLRRGTLEKMRIAGLLKIDTLPGEMSVGYVPTEMAIRECEGREPDRTTTPVYCPTCKCEDISCICIPTQNNVEGGGPA